MPTKQEQVAGVRLAFSREQILITTQLITAVATLLDSVKSTDVRAFAEIAELEKYIRQKATISRKKEAAVERLKRNKLESVIQAVSHTGDTIAEQFIGSAESLPNVDLVFSIPSVQSFIRILESLQTGNFNENEVTFLYDRAITLLDQELKKELENEQTTQIFIFWLLEIGTTGIEAALLEALLPGTSIAELAIKAVKTEPPLQNPKEFPIETNFVFHEVMALLKKGPSVQSTFQLLWFLPNHSGTTRDIQKIMGQYGYAGKGETKTTLHTSQINTNLTRLQTTLERENSPIRLEVTKSPDHKNLLVFSLIITEPATAPVDTPQAPEDTSLTKVKKTRDFRHVLAEPIEVHGSAGTVENKNQTI